MKVIIGLGNPGAQYDNTPHNVGFMSVDMLAEKIGASWEMKRAFKAFLAKGSFLGEQVMLVKPQTFMNLSGEAVAPLVKYHNSKGADLIVIQDDIDLPLGKLRIRKDGSCGGHNGMRNIIERLGTQSFTRLKIGVGKDRSNVIGHVLGKFDPASQEIAKRVVLASIEVIASILRDGPDSAMNQYNGKSFIGA